MEQKGVPRLLWRPGLFFSALKWVRAVVVHTRHEMNESKKLIGKMREYLIRIKEKRDFRKMYIIFVYTIIIIVSKNLQRIAFCLQSLYRVIRRTTVESTN